MGGMLITLSLKLFFQNFVHDKLEIINFDKFCFSFNINQEKETLRNKIYKINNF